VKFMPAVPPFPDTTYFCRDIIRDSDPTFFVNNLTDAGQGVRVINDRRRGGVTANAYLFNATYYDGLTVEIQVLTEFENENADIRKLAETYGRALGQLPTGVRTSVKSMPIIPGNMPWGGGNDAVTIHAGRDYGDMRGTTLMHEAAHASLDMQYAWSADFTPNPLWKAAQQADDAFISIYARDNPESEDVAESYVAYVALRYRSARIPRADADKIVRTIPNRIAFFDARPLPMDPIIQLPPPLKLVRAKASSELTEPYNDKPQTADRLIEGPNNGAWFWNSDNQGRDPKPWFSLELEHRSIVGGLYIRWKMNYGNVGARPLKYKVLSSTDGTSWSETGVDQSCVRGLSPDFGAEMLPGWSNPTQFIKVEMSESSYGPKGYFTCCYVLVTGKPSYAETDHEQI
jgi:F5/8 type C domain